jgi:hypothetical protein
MLSPWLGRGCGADESSAGGVGLRVKGSTYVSLSKPFQRAGQGRGQNRCFGNSAPGALAGRCLVLAVWHSHCQVVPPHAVENVSASVENVSASVWRFYTAAAPRVGCAWCDVAP